MACIVLLETAQDLEQGARTPARRMYVGVLRLSLSIVGARSLKDKRSVVRSFKDRMQSRYRVSIAEVGALDVPKRAVIGVAVVSSSSTLCDQVLADVASAANTLKQAVLDDRSMEILPFGSEGGSVRGGIEAALDEHPFQERWDDEPEDDE